MSVELARVAAAFDGIYDTHDRDLGASYRGVGYLNSIREGDPDSGKMQGRASFSATSTRRARPTTAAHPRGPN